jgi:HSP20 family protein
MLTFDPFRDLERFSDQLTRSGSAASRVPRFMPIDLYRSGDHYVLHADLPGVDPGSVDVQVDNGTLSISAERSARTEESGEWLASERFAGAYRRQVMLGDGVDPDRISASYEQGVVTVIIPIAERAKARKIEIATSGSGGSPAIETSATG